MKLLSNWGWQIFCIHAYSRVLLRWNPGMCRPISRGCSLCWEVKDSFSCVQEAKFELRRGIMCERWGWRMPRYYTEHSLYLNSPSSTRLALSSLSLLSLPPCDRSACSAIIVVCGYHCPWEWIFWESCFRDIAHHSSVGTDRVLWVELWFRCSLPWWR